MRALDRKLLRDLSRMRMQAAAIAAVIAVGVMLQVAMSGVVSSLNETRRAYYERQRMADVFVPFDHAPRDIVRRLAAIDGVARAEGRVTGSGLILMPGEAVPLRARLLSLPERGRPLMNDVFLISGRMPSGLRNDEALVIRSFAEARGLVPGDRLRMTVGGRQTDSRITGIVEAPEFIYATPPGEIAPDPARYAVIWLNLAAAEAALDESGAVNEVLIALARGADQNAVIAAADRAVQPYGGLGAYPLAEQVSNRFVTDEIDGMGSSAHSVPPVFMAVAAYLLSMVVARMIHAEQGQIGLLKAFGLTGAEIAGHYLRLALVIAGAGALAGALAGAALQQVLAEYYQSVFRLPYLILRPAPGAYLLAIGTSLGAAALGALLVLRRLFRLMPAAAMRPPAPPDQARALQLPRAVIRLLDRPTRMVLRGVMRQPMRALGAVLGMALGMALSMAMVNMLAAFDRTLTMTFTVLDRGDISLTLTQPVSIEALADLRRIPGVLEVEGGRSVASILRNGARSYRAATLGMTGAERMKPALRQDLSSFPVPAAGRIVLSHPVARLLQVGVGDRVTVELLDGPRPKVELTVASLTQTYIGSPSYLRMETLNALLDTPMQVSDITLRVDPKHRQQVLQTLAGMPQIAGVAVKSASRAALEKVMNTGAGAARFLMAVVAGVISFGIVYNSGRVAFAERSHDLASLRVLGYSRAETAYVLVAEFALLTLAAIPLGLLLGSGLTQLLAQSFSTDLYTLPAVTDPASGRMAALALLGSLAVSTLVLVRALAQLDILESLKSRE